MPDKRLLVEVVGGDVDGRTYDSDSPDPIERQMADMLFRMTRQGALGNAFHGFSMSCVEELHRGMPMPDTISRDGATHKYEVVDRSEDDDKIVVRLRYSVNRPR